MPGGSSAKPAGNPAQFSSPLLTPSRPGPRQLLTPKSTGSPGRRLCTPCDGILPAAGDSFRPSLARSRSCCFSLPLPRQGSSHMTSLTHYTQHAAVTARHTARGLGQVSDVPQTQSLNHLLSGGSRGELWDIDHHDALQVKHAKTS